MKKTRIRLFIFLLFTIVWALCSRHFLGLPFCTSASFFAFLLLIIYIPGACLLSFSNYCFPVKEQVLFSFCLGFSLEMAVYFILAAAHLLSVFSSTLVGLSIVSLVLLLFRRKKLRSSISFYEPDTITALLCAISIVMTFVLLSMANLEPALVGARPYYHDTLNGVGLTVSASRSFPLQSLQMSGWIFPYHTGYYIYTASIMEMLGVTAFESVIKLSLIPIAPLNVLAFSVIADRLKTERLVKTVQLFSLSIIPSFYYIHYLYMDTIGYPFGLLLCQSSLLLFFTGSRKSLTVNVLHLLASFTLSAAMVSKGPLAVPFLFGICFVLLIELIKEHNLHVFVKGLLYVVPFFTLYYLIYGSGASDSMFFYPLFSAIQTPFALSLSSSIPTWLFKLLCVLYYIPSLSLTLFVSFIIVLFSQIRKNNTSFVSVFCLSAVSIGYILLNLFKQEGSSETYFVSGVYPVCYLLAGKILADCLFNKRKKGKIVTFVLVAFLALSAIPDIQTSLSMFLGDDATNASQATGFLAASTYSIENNKKGVHPDPSLIHGASVTPGQYEAYIWLRDNTAPDAVFSDYRYSVHNKYFAASVFSERSCYLEGWGYLTMDDKNNNTEEKVRRDTIVRFFNDTKEESFCVLLKNEGVDYLVFEKEITGDWELTDKFVDEVFRNNDVIIYHIRDVDPS